MQDFMAILFLVIFSILGLFFLNKQLKEERRRFAKQEQLIDLMIRHYEIDNEK